MFSYNDNLRIMKNTCFAIFCFLSGVLFAQQDPHFTQYFENTLFVNPAYAGSRGALNITSVHREQWTGFDGRPQSSTLSIHSPMKNESVGLGLTLVNDAIGPMNQTMVYGDYSFKLKFSEKSHLALGMKAGVNLINLNTQELTTNTANDPNLQSSSNFRVNPNFGFGAYYHSEHFFAGFSIPKLLERSYSDLDDPNRSIEQRHYYTILGGIFNLNSSVKLRPTCQVKMTAGAPISIDLALTSILNDKFWIGSMFRYNAAIGFFTQYSVNESLRIGLATDFGIQQIRNFNSGTFEAMISYDFSFEKNGIRSPRYF